MYTYTLFVYKLICIFILYLFIFTELLNDAHVILLVKTIYTPYRPHIEKYDSLEEQQLIASLQTLNLVSLIFLRIVLYILYQRKKNHCLSLLVPNRSYTSVNSND